MHLLPRRISAARNPLPPQPITRRRLIRGLSTSYANSHNNCDLPTNPLIFQIPVVVLFVGACSCLNITFDFKNLYCSIRGSYTLCLARKPLYWSFFAIPPIPLIELNTLNRFRLGFLSVGFEPTLKCSPSSSAYSTGSVSCS